MTTTCHKDMRMCNFERTPRPFPSEERTGFSWPDPDAFEYPGPKDFDISFSSVLKHAEQFCPFVDIDLNFLGGTPRIDGTRIPVYMVLNAIDEHGSIEGAMKAYRSLTEEQVRDALRFSVHVLESPLEHQSSSTGR